MDIGPHNVDAEDLSIAANAFDQLGEIVEGILERHVANDDFERAEAREIVSRKIVDAVVRRMSGIDQVKEEAGE